MMLLKWKVTQEEIKMMKKLKTQTENYRSYSFYFFFCTLYFVKA